MRQHTVFTPYMVGETHFYSTQIEGELILFDTGPPTPDGVACLEQEVDIKRLKYVFITHTHVDHCGLAAHLARNSPAEIFFARKDAVKLLRHEERIAYIKRLVEEFGFDDVARGMRAVFEKTKIFPDVPDRFTVLEESDVPAKLGMSWLSCPGHSQTDVVYLWGSHAVSGDVLLHNIFQAPFLDVDLDTFNGRFRNYAAYCASLLQLRKLDGYEICPGHRNTVISVDETIRFYVRKLVERARQVKRYDDIESIRELIEHLFNGSLLEPFVVYLKVSEIVFMRDFLADPGRLERSLEQIGLADAAHEFRLLPG
jgi:2,4-dienoyl-CoA reductase (NADPH2)